MVAYHWQLILKLAYCVPLKKVQLCRNVLQLRVDIRVYLMTVYWLVQ